MLGWNKIRETSTNQFSALMITSKTGIKRIKCVLWFANLGQECTLTLSMTYCAILDISRRHIPEAPGFTLGLLLKGALFYILRLLLPAIHFDINIYIYVSHRMSYMDPMGIHTYQTQGTPNNHQKKGDPHEPIWKNPMLKPGLSVWHARKGYWWVLGLKGWGPPGSSWFVTPCNKCDVSLKNCSSYSCFMFLLRNHPTSSCSPSIDQSVYPFQSQHVYWN